MIATKGEQTSATWLIWPELLLPGLSLVFGLQILRTLWPYLRYLLYDRFELSPVLAGFIGLAILAAAFLLGAEERRLGLRRLLLLSAGGLGLARLAMQLWSGDPLLDFILAGVGTVCFLLFLPAYLAVVRSAASDSPERRSRYAGAILWGVAVDLALHGLFLSYDFIWQSGPGPLLLGLGLTLLQGLALWSLFPTVPPVAKEGTFRQIIPWLGLGPYLALQILVLQNPARLAGLTGWLWPAAFAWVLLSHLIALGVTLAWSPRSRVTTSLIGLALTGSLFLVDQTPAWVAALAWLTGQAAAAILLKISLTGLTGEVDQQGLRRTGLVHGAGMMLMGGFIFVTYVPLLGRPLPAQLGWYLGLAGLTLILSAMGAVKPRTELHPAGSKNRLITQTSWLLLGCPLYIWLTWQPPAPAQPVAGPIRLMTYNIHNGFNTQGQLDLEELVQVIEAAQPDILALQEVSRGDIVNGGGDMLSWLAQRLRLPYSYTPAGDAMWGQATFSRYPILVAESHALPPADLPVGRSFLYTQIDLGQDIPFYLINTHFHAGRRRDEHIRQPQAQAILDFLTQRGLNQAVVAGDLNALPDSPTLQTFLEAGFLDVIDATGVTPGNTASSENPVVRIDYILITTGLEATQAGILSTTASDHLPVVATVKLK